MRKGDYSDIINIDYQTEIKPRNPHPPMSIEDRAKIFGSFAALRGYEEKIAEKREEVIDYTNHHLIEREDFFDD